MHTPDRSARLYRRFLRLRLDLPVVTNIVRFDTSALAPAPKFVDLLAKEGGSWVPSVAHLCVP